MAKQTEYSVESVQLTSLVKALKEDLQTYHQQQLTSKEPALFAVTGATVEAEVMATASTEREGGVDLKVVKLGHDSAKTSGVVFHLSLSLTIPSDKGPFMVGTKKGK